MRNVPLTLGLMLGIGLLACDRLAAEPLGNDGDVKQVIEQLEQQRHDAILQGNVEALDRLYADGYLSTTFAGQVRTKEQSLAAYRSGNLKFESLEDDEVVVRVYGDTAVVTGRNTATGNDQDRRIEGQRRFTHVWVKQDNHWRLVATHTSPIAP